MSRRSIALPSSQQPLLQVRSQSKSNPSQSYTLFKYRFAASSVLPSPRLINVSSCHFAACHFNRSSAEPLHRRWHAPPRRLMTVMARVTLTARLPSRFLVGGMHPPGVSPVSRNGVLLHFVRAVSLLLAQCGLAFVRHGSISADDDDIITMMMSSRRCRRLPHTTALPGDIAIPGQVPCTQ